MFKVIFFLIFLHFLVDNTYYLAGNEGNYEILAYSFIWAGAIAAGLLFFEMFTIWKALFLVIGQFVINKWEAESNNYYITQVSSFSQLGMVILL